MRQTPLRTIPPRIRRSPRRRPRRGPPGGSRRPVVGRGVSWCGASLTDGGAAAWRDASRATVTGGGTRVESGQVVSRVHRLAVEHDLEMEVAPGRPARCPLVADQVADLHHLAHVDDFPGEVPVPRLQPLAVPEDDAYGGVAIVEVRPPIGEDHAIGCGVDRSPA